MEASVCPGHFWFRSCPERQERCYSVGGNVPGYDQVHIILHCAMHLGEYLPIKCWDLVDYEGFPFIVVGVLKPVQVSCFYKNVRHLLFTWLTVTCIWVVNIAWYPLCLNRWCDCSEWRFDYFPRKWLCGVLSERFVLKTNKRAWL